MDLQSITPEMISITRHTTTTRTWPTRFQRGSVLGLAFFAIITIIVVVSTVAFSTAAVGADIADAIVGMLRNDFDYSCRDTRSRELIEV